MTSVLIPFIFDPFVYGKVHHEEMTLCTKEKVNKRRALSSGVRLQNVVSPLHLSWKE
jgi:hypothetical protein